jgi:hypothetical protein
MKNKNKYKYKTTFIFIFILLNFHNTFIFRILFYTKSIDWRATNTLGNPMPPNLPFSPQQQQPQPLPRNPPSLIWQRPTRIHLFSVSLPFSYIFLLFSHHLSHSISFTHRLSIHHPFSHRPTRQAEMGHTRFSVRLDKSNLPRRQAFYISAWFGKCCHGFGAKCRLRHFTTGSNCQFLCTGFYFGMPFGWCGRGYGPSYRLNEVKKLFYFF